MPSLAIVLTNEYADWKFAPIAAMAKEFYNYTTHIVSPAGLLSMPEYKLEDIKAVDFDALIIIGGKIWEGNSPPT